MDGYDCCCCCCCCCRRRRYHLVWILGACHRRQNHHHPQASSPGVVAAVDETDFRANLAHGETRSLGASQAFPDKCVRTNWTGLDAGGRRRSIGWKRGWQSQSTYQFHVLPLTRAWKRTNQHHHKNTHTHHAPCSCPWLHAHKQTIQRTNTQTNKQTRKQSNTQTNKQTNKQTHKQTHVHAHHPVSVPGSFWADNVRRRKQPTLFSKDGLRHLLYSPRGR